MKEEFGIEVSVGNFMGESCYRYQHGTIRLLAYQTTWLAGEFALNAHTDCRWVFPSQLDEFDFAAADIPLVDKLQQSESLG
jgi:8-oxo-dGTP diphosphatase